MFLGSSRCVRESRSPNSFFFHQSYSKCNNNFGILFIIKEEWRKKNISESSVSHWLCIELFWKGGSVIFGFYLVSRCLSATLYFVRNQSPMWQETVLFEHKVIRKVLSLNKKILWSARDSLTKSMKNMNPTFNYMMLLGCFPLTMVYFSLFLHVPSLLKYS